MATNSPLPHNFLEGKGPNVIVQRIDFQAKGLSRYADAYAVILDNVFTAEECQQLVAAAETAVGGRWDRAMVNGESDVQELRLDVRNCGRIMWDDRTVVQKLWNRIKEHVPELQMLDETGRLLNGRTPRWEDVFEFTRLNERMRFLKYGPNEYFAKHYDGIYETPDGSEQSYYTLHLYLNESTPDSELVGGATTFHGVGTKRELRVKPRVGRVLIFQHQKLLHSGEEVLEGLKLTLRTDLMYKLVELRG